MHDATSSYDFPTITCVYALSADSCRLRSMSSATSSHREWYRCSKSLTTSVSSPNVAPPSRRIGSNLIELDGGQRLTVKMIGMVLLVTVIFRHEAGLSSSFAIERPAKDVRRFLPITKVSLMVISQHPLPDTTGSIKKSTQRSSNLMSLMHFW